MTPAFILVRPQLAENIGAAARAMMNCAIEDMRLVRPYYPALSKASVAMAAGAESILENARVFDTTQEAVADLQIVYATTARKRDMVKPVLTGSEFASHVTHALGTGLKSGILFGKERTGLENDDVSLSDYIINIPLNPQHCSLNLAQAVLLVGYELFTLRKDQIICEKNTPHKSASKIDLLHLFKHLEEQLELKGYFRISEKKSRQVRNLRNIFTRADLTEQEVRTLHGVINDLTRTFGAS